MTFLGPISKHLLITGSAVLLVQALMKTPMCVGPTVRHIPVSVTYCKTPEALSMSPMLACVTTQSVLEDW